MKKQNTNQYIDISQELLKQRIVYLGEEITDDLANVIIAQLLYLDSQNTQDIYLYINSPGGVVTAGMAIFDTMSLIRSDVVTVCAGTAASMASVILMNGTKGKRYILPHSTVMIHQPLGGVQGQATEIEIHAKEILRIKDQMTSIISKLTGQSEEKVRQDTERDNFLTAQDALDYGIVDHIYLRKGDTEANKN